MSRFHKRTQKPIPVELLGAALQAIARIPERDNVPSALEARSDLLMAIQFRLEALAQLQNQPS